MMLGTTNIKEIKDNLLISWGNFSFSHENVVWLQPC